VSSLSGSASEASDDDEAAAAAAPQHAAQRGPQVEFRLGAAGPYALVYKALLASAAEMRAGVTAASWTGRLRTALAERPWRWAILMCGGGHFAGALFDGPTMAASKTFHRYTTRRKQGGSQSANDQAKGKANSMGAQLRRYNERALQQDIRDLMAEWRAQLAECHRIFVVVPSRQGRAALFEGDDAPLQSSDPRVHRVPFTTRRPTKSEVERIHRRLATVALSATPRSSTVATCDGDSATTASVPPAPVPSAKHAPPSSEQAPPPQRSPEEDLSPELQRIWRDRLQPALIGQKVRATGAQQCTYWAERSSLLPAVAKTASPRNVGSSGRCGARGVG